MEYVPKEEVTAIDVFNTIQAGVHNIKPFKLSINGPGEFNVNGQYIPMNKFLCVLSMSPEVNNLRLLLEQNKHINVNIEQDFSCDDYIDDPICGGYPGGKAPGEAMI